MPNLLELPHDYFTGANLFFVTGRSKSGTTWMAKILDAHPNLHCDTDEYPIFRYDIKVSFGEDNAYNPRNSNMLMQRRIDFSLRNGMLAGVLMNTPLDDNLKLIGQRTPNLDPIKIFQVFSETKIIYMLRDPRDQLVSLAYHLKNLGDGKGIFNGECLENDFIRHFVRLYLERGDHNTARYASEQIKVVRYEEISHFIMNPVFKWLGVSVGPTSTCMDKASFQTITGRKNGEEDSSSFYRKGIQGDWVNHFSEDNIKAFKNCGGIQLMSEMGYSW